MRFDTGQSITGAIGQATCDIAHDLKLHGDSDGLGNRKNCASGIPLPAPCADHLRDQSPGNLPAIWRWSGVFRPVMVDMADDSDSMMQACIDAASRTGLVQRRRHCCPDRRRPCGPPRKSTNFIKIHRIGQPLRPE